MGKKWAEARKSLSGSGVSMLNSRRIVRQFRADAEKGLTVFRSENIVDWPSWASDIVRRCH